MTGTDISLAAPQILTSRFFVTECRQPMIPCEYREAASARSRCVYSANLRIELNNFPDSPAQSFLQPGIPPLWQPVLDFSRWHAYPSPRAVLARKQRVGGYPATPYRRSTHSLHCLSRCILILGDTRMQCTPVLSSMHRRAMFPKRCPQYRPWRRSAPNPDRLAQICG